MALSNDELRRYWTDGPGVEHIGEPADARYEYAAFNDPTVLEESFARGDISVQMRFVLDEPLYTGTLWSVARWVRLMNEERAANGKLDEAGLILIKRRTVVETPWAQVSYDEVNESLGI